MADPPALDTHDEVLRRESAPVSVTPERTWSTDADAPFRVRHNLADTGLFDLERLRAIAFARPSAAIPCGRGTARANERPEPGSIVAAITTQPGWAVFRDECWLTPQGEALDTALACIRDWLGDRDPGMQAPERAVIVTSARAITHLHLDVDESFLLQVRGTKTVGFMPPHLISPDEIDDVVRGRGRPLSIPRDKVKGTLRKFVIGPGEGVHVPFGWPHFTRVEGQASVSVSLAFQTERTLARRAAALRP